MKTMNNLKELAMREFKKTVEDYMLPLFDNRGELKCKQIPSANNELISFVNIPSGKTVVRFFPCIGSSENPTPFFCEIGTYSTNALKKPAIQILRELLKVAEYRFWNSSFKKQRNYGKGASRQAAYKKRTMDIAFELGMCLWLAPSTETASTLHSIVCRMVEWSGRTYEGKNVPFGIAIDFDTTSPDDFADYLHFLENDSSAVFTDGIFSGIMLDKRGKLVSFLTRHTIPPESDQAYEVFVPYQFADLAQHCINKTIGIIVLTNGEILLIKNREVCFAKRGSKWVYFDWHRIESSLRPYFLLSEFDEATIKERMKTIYCTLLDVSFSHTGGCLALVLPCYSNDIKTVISDRFDLSIAGEPPSGISAESKEKIEVLKYLLVNKEQSVRSFFELEKPLRREILSLDGATVVSLSGLFYCAGSIVAVPGGSSGGGRTAAAKRLAEFGVGIKISEDGYIEAFGVPMTRIVPGTPPPGSPRIEPLFKIK